MLFFFKEADEDDDEEEPDEDEDEADEDEDEDGVQLIISNYKKSRKNLLIKIFENFAKTRIIAKKYEKFPKNSLIFNTIFCEFFDI